MYHQKTVSTGCAGTVGDEIWNKFRMRDKQMHAWYYRSVFESFREFSEYPFYEEYRMLWQKVFGGTIKT